MVGSIFKVPIIDFSKFSCCFQFVVFSVLGFHLSLWKTAIFIDLTLGSNQRIHHPQNSNRRIHHPNLPCTSYRLPVGNVSLRGCYFTQISNTKCHRKALFLNMFFHAPNVSLRVWKPLRDTFADVFVGKRVCEWFPNVPLSPHIVAKICEFVPKSRQNSGETCQSEGRPGSRPGLACEQAAGWPGGGGYGRQLQGQAYWQIRTA